MKNTDRISILILIALLFVACTPKATTVPVLQGENPYAAQAGDSALQRDDVTIDSSTLGLAKSQPPQVMLTFAYFPPTPCHQLRVELNGPDSQNQIDVTAYSVAEKNTACALMALATPLDAGLNLGSFPAGHYSLRLNGTLVGEFDS
jgi:hypothetical protein